MKLRKVLIPIAAGAALYYAVFGGEYSLLDLRHIEREKGAEAARLQSVKHENAELRVRVDSLEDDPAAIERIARERYGMVGDGERLYRFVDTASDTLP